MSSDGFSKSTTSESKIDLDDVNSLYEDSNSDDILNDESIKTLPSHDYTEEEELKQGHVDNLEILENYVVGNYSYPPVQTVLPSTRLCKRLRQLEHYLINQNNLHEKCDIKNFSEKHLEHQKREIENEYFQYSLDEAREMQRGHELKILANQDTDKITRVL